MPPPSGFPTPPPGNYCTVPYLIYETNTFHVGNYCTVPYLIYDANSIHVAVRLFSRELKQPRRQRQGS